MFAIALMVVKSVEMEQFNSLEATKSAGKLGVSGGIRRTTRCSLIHRSTVQALGWSFQPGVLCHVSAHVPSICVTGGTNGMDGSSCLPAS